MLLIWKRRRQDLTVVEINIFFKVPIAGPTRKVLVYKIQVNPIHTILNYGNYYDFMDR